MAAAQQKQLATTKVIAKPIVRDLIRLHVDSRFIDSAALANLRAGEQAGNCFNLLCCCLIYFFSFQSSDDKSDPSNRGDIEGNKRTTIASEQGWPFTC